MVKVDLVGEFNYETILCDMLTRNRKAKMRRQEPCGKHLRPSFVLGSGCAGDVGYIRGLWRRKDGKGRSPPPPF